MNKLLFTLATCILGLNMSGQEIFDMPNATGTYLTGINDSGEICGYYTIASGNTLAFEINKYGDTIKLTGPAGSSYAFVNATGISNNGMVVGNYGTSSATAQPYIFEPNPGRNAGGTYYQVPTWGGTNISASGITSDTCIAGSYQVGSDDDGATWCKSAGTETALRCSNGGTVYPTYMFDLDKNGNSCGFIIQGAQEQAAIYRGVALGWDTFKVGGFIKSRILGMNDNNWICGNYNSETKGYYCQKLPGQNYSNFTTITVIGATTIYPSHINNAKGIVGFYTDAQGVDHGFILATYDIGFRPSVNGYALRNDETVWPPAYYQQFNYHTDPYLNNGSPFFSNGNYTPPRLFLSITNDAWPDMVKAFPLSDAYNTVQGKQVIKVQAVQKWMAQAKDEFQGSCFGFTYTAAMLFDNTSLYTSLFPACAQYAGANVYGIAATNNVIASLCRIQCQEDYGKEIHQYDNDHLNDKVYTVMQAIKQNLRNSRGKPHCGLGMTLQHEAGGHEVFPYKLVPGVNGNGVDTIYIYDSNYPGNNTLYVYCDQKAGHGGDWHYTANGQISDYGGTPNGEGLEATPPDNFFGSVMHLELQGHQGPQYARGSSGYITAFYNDNSRVYMTDDNQAVAYMSIDSDIATTLIQPLNRRSGFDSIEPVLALVTGTLTTVHKATLTDSVASYLGIYDDAYLIRCNRTSGNDTADNYNFSTGNVTYINNTDSGITLAYTISIEDSPAEYNYYITNLPVAGNNKVAVSKYDPAGIVLQNFGPATTYIITTDFVTPDSIITFTGVIPIQANTQHTILPHDTTYSGIYILVDTGMTGHIEDSLFITPTTNTTAISNINTPGIKAWPVPSGNELYISGPQGLVTCKFVDITGRVVSTGEFDFGNGATQKFDVSNLVPGVYTINGYGTQGKWTYMFVKQ